MRVLILSCNTGEGHNSCAKAIKEVVDANGAFCVTEDSLRFISEKTARFISWGHVFMYRNIPWLFNWGYEFTEKHTGFFKERSCVYNFISKGSDKLYDYIVNGSFDTVICTHPFSSLMLTETQRRYELSIKTVFVATDYTCSPSVKDSKLDHYIIPDDLLKAEFECPNIPQEKILPYGIPIRQAFYDHTEKDKAKQAFGISPESKHIVISCGSMGCGPIKKLTGILTERSKEDVYLTVVCGTNDKLKTQLENSYGMHNNLHILGFVKDMSGLLDSADLYLTKAGGISVTEAAVKRLPMIFINAVAGCEDHNISFYTKLGCARTGCNITELTEICEDLITDTYEYEKMTMAFNKLRVQNAAERIYNTLKG